MSSEFEMSLESSRSSGLPPPPLDADVSDDTRKRRERATRSWVCVNNDCPRHREPMRPKDLAKPTKGALRCPECKSCVAHEFISTETDHRCPRVSCSRSDKVLHPRDGRVRRFCGQCGSVHVPEDRVPVSHRLDRERFSGSF